MNRAACDNALLIACDEFSCRLLMGCKVVAAGAVIGCAWWLLVALRAGALS
ncbi:hypothetical protein [Paraburkholderia unamae]|uniref:Uncharacterized protein n=1 Tax=Paraburkholderia unamae TaxID=219649 RepID=A0ABX5KYB9_9BURK|nr:hypothetical protein [Paraburkholderia unamae]PVX86442.1 hypothetical protein C7402_102278 [Paraburkholderia unamae]